LKILVLTTVIKTAYSFLLPHLDLLRNLGHQLDLACNVDHPVREALSSRVDTIFDIPFSRSPFSRSNIKAYLALRHLITQEKYEGIYCHTPVASALARLACRRNPNCKVLYVAHGFHFFQGTSPSGWLIYYPLEYYLSKYTDRIVTINMEDYSRARNSLRAKNVDYVAGVGVDIPACSDMHVSLDKKREELGLPTEAFVALSVGELNSNKNHSVVIKGLAMLKNKNIHYVLCGDGAAESQLRKLVRNYGLERHVHFLGYRSDVAEIHRAADVFVFPSKREGLGLAAIEAMASGLPIITSNVHGIRDYSVANLTGLVCSPSDASCYAAAIDTLMNRPDLRASASCHNRERAKAYDYSIVMPKWKRIYAQTFGEARTVVESNGAR